MFTGRWFNWSRGDRRGGKQGRYTSAVALAYEDDQGAPIVAAKGQHLTAQEIVKIAKRYQVPIVKRAELAHALLLVEEGQEIPTELFEAVAVVLHEIERGSQS